MADTKLKGVRRIKRRIRKWSEQIEKRIALVEHALEMDWPGQVEVLHWSDGQVLLHGKEGEQQWWLEISTCTGLHQLLSPKDHILLCFQHELGQDLQHQWVPTATVASLRLARRCIEKWLNENSSRISDSDE